MDNAKTEAPAALRAPKFTAEDRARQPTAAQAEALWQLLDNIDTLGDTCRGDLAAFQRSAVRLATMRFEVAGSDGYDVYWKADAPRDFTRPGFSYPVGGCKEPKAPSV